MFNQTPTSAKRLIFFDLEISEILEKQAKNMPLRNFMY